MAVLLKDFELKEDSTFLKDIAMTHLVYRENILWLVDGAGKNKPLGTMCRTDWVGRWESAVARHGETTVGGDSTPESDVSGWATDFYRIDIAQGTTSLPNFRLFQDENRTKLAIQAAARTKGGSLITLDDSSDLNSAVKKQGLSASDIEAVYVLVTNTDFQGPIRYEISVFS
jgi:hypothetical protein